MKISIITVTYNSAATLSHTFQSISEQDYDDIEYIVIDGASTDNTVQIISSCSQVSHWISEPDKGIYDAMNKGLKLATGDIVGILNSDDFFADKNVVTRIVNSFKDANTDLVFADIDFVENADLEKVVRHYSSKFFRPWMFRFGFQPAHPTFYTKPEHFKAYGFYRTDLRIAGDFELLLRFMKVNRLQFKYVNDSWVKMRMGGASTAGLASLIKVNTEILKSLKINGIYTNKLMIYSKYLIKWWGYFFRNSR